MSSRPRNVMAFLSGLLFAAGLGLSGMTKPAKVSAFLDVTGDWDPSLMLVMVGAIGVYAVTVLLARRRGTPWLAPSFVWPTTKSVDARLLGGAALFGIGWGLSGLCPGPAIVSVASLAKETLVFFVVLALTLMAVRRLLRARAASTDARAALTE